jgi:hypothetical protein
MKKKLIRQLKEWNIKKENKLQKIKKLKGKIKNKKLHLAKLIKK